MSLTKAKKLDDQYFPNNQDGLPDIFVGLGVFFAGIFLKTELFWMAAIFIPTLMPSFQAARKRFLSSRTDKLDQNHTQTAKANNLKFAVTILLGLIFLTGSILFLSFSFLSNPVIIFLREYFLLMIGLIFSSIWILASMLLKIWRFTIYAGFTLFFMYLAQISIMPFWLSLVAQGVLIGLVGMWTLIMFIQRHPKIY